GHHNRERRCTVVSGRRPLLPWPRRRRRVEWPGIRSDQEPGVHGRSRLVRARYAYRSGHDATDARRRHLGRFHRLRPDGRTVWILLAPTDRRFVGWLAHGLRRHDRRAKVARPDRFPHCRRSHVHRGRLGPFRRPRWQFLRSRLIDRQSSMAAGPWSANWRRCCRLRYRHGREGRRCSGTNLSHLAHEYKHGKDYCAGRAIAFHAASQLSRNYAGIGSVAVTVVPSPGALAMAKVPPCNSTNSLHSGRPRPVPPYLRAIELSTCWNGSSAFGISAAFMPMPVSRTSISAATPRRRSTISTRPPSGVNLMAFDRRLSTTWRSRVWSPATGGTASSTVMSSATPAVCAWPRAMRTASAMTSPTATGFCSISIL